MGGEGGSQFVVNALMIWVKMDPPSANVEGNGFHIMLEEDCRRVALELPLGGFGDADVASEVDVQDYYGREWKLTINKKPNGTYRFTRGWKKFAREARINDGHCLVFKKLSTEGTNSICKEIRRDSTADNNYTGNRIISEDVVAGSDLGA
ncbi:hypothetical protein C2S53_014977 [Perilla frutescens var. hirtella]|uniref:TF-B3 domain-containing protein n=1 Tax=Perilla frutescens var. hirtella TaxID=608512 RepID=A0AAD4P020_PERFH|nr:hypothetical protein C2S53_014977 [Perilla frutescens var. hirtella]